MEKSRNDRRIGLFSTKKNTPRFSCSQENGGADLKIEEGESQRSCHSRIEKEGLMGARIWRKEICRHSQDFKKTSELAVSQSSWAF